LTAVIGFAGLILAFSLVQEQNNVRNLDCNSAYTWTPELDIYGDAQKT
jgi:hypothetical protein